MIQVEDEDGTAPEWQVPEATAVLYTVYDLSHPISHLDEYLHIILLCMNAQLHPQVTIQCVAYAMSLWHWTHPPFSTLCLVQEQSTPPSRIPLESGLVVNPSLVPFLCKAPDTLSLRMGTNSSPRIALSITRPHWEIRGVTSNYTFVDTVPSW